jgi:ribosome-associated toxin RatA of RatAB toxin-antitoxin module
MLLYLLIALAVTVVGFVLVVAMQPSKFCITRSALIPAPASALFEQVNDFHHWEAWSPWAKMDPHVVNTYTGTRSGVGAIFEWEGNNQVGQGRMTILESRPDKLIRIKLEFLKPFKATNTSEFTFKPQGDQTAMTWSMTGINNFINKAFVLLMNCGEMIGGQFEKGLENLKTVVTTHEVLR